MKSLNNKLASLLYLLIFSQIEQFLLHKKSWLSFAITKIRTIFMQFMQSDTDLKSKTCEEQMIIPTGQKINFQMKCKKFSHEILFPLLHIQPRPYICCTVDKI